MSIILTDELILIDERRHEDHRGYFGEIFSSRRYQKWGLTLSLFRAITLSYAVGILRGLHFQEPPHAQGKLVCYGHGSIYDVASKFQWITDE